MIGNWIKYQNGNYTVSIDLNTGTKIRENDLDYFKADFPESMDIKLTDKCNMGCYFCHENSSPNGANGDILSNNFIDKLHPYTELALGGGNVLEHPDFYKFLIKCRDLKLICNTTLRQEHFMQNLDFVRKLRDEKLIYGLGISLSDPWRDGFIESIKEFPNAVVHVINGIVTMQELEELRYHSLKVLILGYKEFRRGKKLYETNARDRIDGLKQDLYNYLPEIVNHGWFDVVSFDNLAIKQLNPQRLMSKEKWDSLYMGDDGIDGEMTSASMYVDLVKKEFARNSCSKDRFPLMETAEEMFNFLRCHSK